MDFLEQNLKQPNVKQTTSGLQYKVLREGDGTGIFPRANERVKVHCITKLENGKELQDTHTLGEPLKFKLSQGQVVKGFDEGIRLMEKGAKFMLYIPPTLGYGTTKDFGEIKPTSVLVCEVELLEIY